MSAMSELIAEAIDANLQFLAGKIADKALKFDAENHHLDLDFEDGVVADMVAEEVMKMDEDEVYAISVFGGQDDLKKAKDWARDCARTTPEMEVAEGRLWWATMDELDSRRNT